MRLLIHDANVLMDLLGMHILERALDLPYDMETTDLVRLEVEDPAQSEILESCVAARTLGVIQTDADQLVEIGRRMAACSALSLADCSVLFHAETLNGAVLTGDGRMRKEAERVGLEVHGTLWILRRMVESCLLSRAEGAVSLEALMNHNPRLPRPECEGLLKAWSESPAP